MRKYKVEQKVQIASTQKIILLFIILLYHMLLNYLIFLNLHSMITKLFNMHKSYNKSFFKIFRIVF